MKRCRHCGRAMLSDYQSCPIVSSESGGIRVCVAESPSINLDAQIKSVTRRSMGLGLGLRSRKRK